MLVCKVLMVSTVLALTIVPVMAGVGSAAADGVRVIVPVPLFVPGAEFRPDDGYYRSGNGRYYHYDRDRDGWHYGRNHREGVRYEQRRGGRK